MPVRSLGYIRLESKQPEAWKTFAGEFLGLMPVEGPTGNALYFRMDSFPARLVVTSSAESRLEALGFDVDGPAELDRLAKAIDDAGVEVSALTTADCAERRVTAGISFDDPAGIPLELFWGPALVHTPVVTPAVSGFVTGDLGMGHVVVTAENGKEAVDFYIDTLGFKARNTMKVGDETLWFLGCNARHHTVGILPMGGPGRLVHFMVEVATLDDLGRAIDRAEQLEVPVMQTLGRHTNDRMVSTYLISPDGFAVEYGWDGLLVKEEEPVYEITHGAFWGHKFVNFPRL
jgi:3,4-dihydroxy-9,10-secoandrosta-1,3,5(10)-triene-9,17-dione 4,5-dioxygenase